MRDASFVLEKGDGSRMFRLETVEERKAFLLNMQEEDHSSQNKLFRTSLIRDDQIAFAEEICMEEASFTIPARLYARRYFHLDEKLYICYLSPGSTMRDKNWESKKWDNLQVWMTVIEGSRARGMFLEYQQELEYLFFTQGVGWSLVFIFQRGGILTKEEWKIFAEITKKMVPVIRENPYMKNESYPLNKAWRDLLLAVLDMEFTDENAEIANDAVGKCVPAF